MNFDGISASGSAPPDNVGAVGPAQFVEMVNSRFAVYSKTGAVLLSPRATNTLWSGFGGGCQDNNDGDGTVLFDTASQRWVIQQFSVSTTPYLDCVAVSTSSDATGSWNRYSFQYANFPDYPKMGVWSDGYYLSVNLFDAAGTTGMGAETCAFDRAAMLSGAAASQQCFMATTSGETTLLPATLDGATQPPGGEPEWFVALSPTTANALAYWKLHVDWTTPAASSLSGPSTLPVNAFAQACGGRACIPQAGTSQLLDSLGDRLMYRLAYRNFGDHEAMVVSHAVAAGASVGMRWYELRPSGGSLGVFQQGTYAPDGTYRWMGSIAMDRSGDMALGYSTSSGALHPGVAYTGRLAGDPLGAMPQGAASIFTGAGSQTGSSLSRWGDYTEMSVDPSDDCTFWYANEYEPTDGAFNWSTRIASFKFPSCGGSVADDFSVSASPSSLSLTPGGSATSTITTALTGGAAQGVSLSASGLPAGASASFNPASVTAGGSSTLTIATSSSTPAGTYAVAVTGTGPSATHSTTVSLVVTATGGGAVVVNGGFETGTFSGWSTGGAASSIVTTHHGGSYAAELGSTSPTNGDSTMAQTITVPAGGATLSFWYQPHCPDTLTYDQEQMQIRSTGGTVLATLLNVCSNSGAWTQVTQSLAAYAGQTVVLSFDNHDDNYSGDPTYTLVDDVTVTAAPVTNDFSLSASPSSVSATQGGSVASTLATALTSGAAQTVSLSASGLPAGATAGFSPLSVTAGGSSTMTIATAPSRPAGTYTVTVTGTGSTATHSTTVSLTVKASSGAPVVANGGFETGTFTGWTTSGASSIVTTRHSGSFAAELGSSSPTNGDSTLSQTITVPAAGGTLSFWYQPHCADTLTYDQEQMQIRSAGGTTLATVLNVCSNSGVWTQVSQNLAAYAGQTIVLRLNNHDDNFDGDATYTLFDDISVG